MSDGGCFSITSVAMVESSNRKSRELGQQHPPLLAEKDMEDDVVSASSLLAGVTASTASGSGHEVAEASAAVPSDGGISEKHPLHNEWCLWVLLHNQSKKDNWQNSQMNVHAFRTVEDFWRLYNNIKSPSRVGVIDFSVFKKDIAPAWEDETCRRGGRWFAKIDKMRAQEFDELWLTLILTMIGESFGEQGSCICGSVVSFRAKSSKIALWVSVPDESQVLPLGHAFHQMLQDAGFVVDLLFDNFALSKATFTIKSSGEVRRTPEDRRP